MGGIRSTYELELPNVHPESQMNWTTTILEIPLVLVFLWAETYPFARHRFKLHWQQLHYGHLEENNFQHWDPHLKEVEIALFRDLVAFLVFLAGNAFQDTFHCLTATSTEGVARYGEDHWDKRNLTLIILMARYNTTYSFAPPKKRCHSSLQHHCNILSLIRQWHTWNLLISQG